MKSKRKRHVNEHIRTSLANSGRVAGMGILYDDYSEESGKPRYDRSAYPVYTTDWLEEKEKERLPGPVITKRLEDCNDSKICRALLKEYKRACQSQGAEEQDSGK